MSTPTEAFSRVLETFDRFEIPYFVGGSVASSSHGIPRTTMDVDIVADIRPDQIDDFAAALKAEFYADPEMMKDAVARGRSFNLIHYETAYKFDVFPLQDDEYSRTQLGRRTFGETKSLGKPIECAIATAEDTILNKLRWYRAGGETSERQWNDLRGILMVSGARLDREYLRHWAPALGVADLLEKLLGEQP